MTLEKPLTEPPKRTIGPVTTASALGGAVATVIVWLVHALWGVEIPDLVESALGLIITVAGTITGGFLVKPRKTGEHVAT